MREAAGQESASSWQPAQSRAAPGAPLPSPAGVEEGFSLRTSLVSGAGRGLLVLLGSSSGTSVLDDADGAVGIVEDLVRNAPNIGLGDLVNAIHRTEQLPPIAVPSLIDRQLCRESLVVGQASNQVGLAAGLDHLEFVVADV